MKKCPICKTDLAVLGLKYEKKFDQYMCSKCNFIHLDSNIGLVTKYILVELKTMMNIKRFNILLERLEKNVERR